MVRDATLRGKNILSATKVPRHLPLVLLLNVD